jgi:hypothetical protein
MVGEHSQNSGSYSDIASSYDPYFENAPNLVLYPTQKFWQMHNHQYNIESNENKRPTSAKQVLIFLQSPLLGRCTIITKITCTATKEII